MDDAPCAPHGTQIGNEAMGPITLFDKSFIQMLTLDEACLFDNFFMTNLAPIYLIEVLGDLAKAEDRAKAQRMVETLAEKTPSRHIYPNAFHQQLVQGELMGQAVDMSGRPNVFGGRYARGPDGLHVVHEEQPQMIAFSRWQNGEFFELERDIASRWRETVRNIDLHGVAASAREVKEHFGAVRTLEDARGAAARLLDDPARQWAVLKTICANAGFGGMNTEKIRKRWIKAGKPTPRLFAPYAAHVFEVDVFLQIALMLSQISPDRPSNRVDIAYLYYLPFCSVFVSRDRLHQRAAPLFLRPNQDFVWGDDLKSDLAALNVKLLELPEEVREQGLMKFAGRPPVDHQGKVAELWDRHASRWRQRQATPPMPPEKEKELLARLKAMDQFSPMPAGFRPRRVADAEPNSMMFKRSIHRRQGSWYILPKDFDPDADARGG